ncbi:murein transglycosylase A [Caulobacter hibisci]|uniref:peptidoglycan lytic exotransglycosylase n=1 Tax=Caulobacter hibisci TaxID=2035993 RepID=A0ABS0SVK5_9CAUL|nr:MltA domain-containing protein [Caulobacter hibisci]MBI1683436.1 MltA domain-containing protein [Caulobacter hibisci]
MLRNVLTAAAAALLLAACTTATPPPPIAPTTPVSPSTQAPQPTPQQPPAPATGSFAALQGWSEEDHAAALQAFRETCGVSKDAATAGICRKARAAGPVDDARARLFLEANFRPEPIAGQGLLTAYFAPEYDARMSRSAEFSAPVRGRPADLVMLDLGGFDPSLKGKTIAGRVAGAGFVPYDDRAAIEASPLDRPLAWMRPEDLFFLQIQGSGVLTLPDGRRVRAAFAAHNGKPFVGIATAMRDRGLLADGDTSGEAIRGWLAANRGPRADEIMRLNPRYVFFQTLPDDGRQATGAANVPLPAGRAIAVDPSQNALGGLYWIDASAPKLAGAFPTYRRAVMALDTGGAIKGAVRADLYMGTGQAAGTEAGRVRHDLRLWRLVPQSQF